MCGRINGTEYRSKLLARGGGKFVMVLDKALQKAIGFAGQAMSAAVTMAPEEEKAGGESPEKAMDNRCGMDLLTAIKTRQSIRKFTERPVNEEMVNAIVCAGMRAPTAKNKRPCHFIVITDRQLLSALARQNTNAAMVEAAAGAIVVCGDKNRGDQRVFIRRLCRRHTKHAAWHPRLGAGRRLVRRGAQFRLAKAVDRAAGASPKVEPVSVIAFGWPDETKELCDRWEAAKVHCNRW